jgi:ferredoxin-2, mitochondrial
MSGCKKSFYRTHWKGDELTIKTRLSTIPVTFIDRQNQEHLLQAAEGESLLNLAQRNGLNIEGVSPSSLHNLPVSFVFESNTIISGACGGTCACSTCHIIVENQDVFRKLPDPDGREYDMLDMAFGLTETSRLACQLKASDNFKATKLRIPKYGSFTPTSMQP